MDLLFKLSIWVSAIAVLLKLAYEKLRERHSLIKYLNVKGVENVLLVTAHPDDECMFFGPVIRVLAELGCNMQVLCLSKGLGCGREKELIESCKVMGVVECFCVDDERLADGMDEDWEVDVVKEHVLEVLNKRLEDLVITFDSHGVSGHPNHIAVSKGTTAAWREFKKHPLELAQLESVWLWRKYLGLINYAIDAFRTVTIAVPVPYEAFWIGQEAMKRHASQLLWFRKLYLIFSRYVYLNSFVILAKE